MFASFWIGTNRRLTTACCIANPKNTETVISRCTVGQVSGCGRSTDKAAFQRFAQFERYLALIERPGSGEMVVVFCADRQTDGQQ